MTRNYFLSPLIVLAVLSAGAFLSEQIYGQDGVTKLETKSILLNEWDGPFGGVPPWRSVNPDEFLAAFDAAIELSTADVERIANNPAPPTFENTIVALEHAGRTLERVSNIFDVHSSNLNLGPIPDIEMAVAPKLSKHSDSIMQNEKLFARVVAVFEGDEMKSLSTAQKRLVDDRYKSFVRQGARLGTDSKRKLSEINSQLAGLFTQFSQNVLADESKTIAVTSPAELEGLPESVVDAMAAAGREGAKEGDKSSQWVINNTRSSMEPVLTYAKNRDLREKVWRTYYSRGDNGDERDNNQLITAILKLRAERAILLGYKTHAHWRLEPQMAKTPEAAMNLMLGVWPKAVARVK